MAPTIHIKLNGAGSVTAPCNISAFREGACAFTLHLGNLTGLDGGAADADDGVIDAQRDGEGAMKFIIAVLLVYSLMGTTGMLILRIRKTANKRNRKANMKEANRYLKYRDKISMECQRAKRVLETKRVLRQMQAIENQKLCRESQSSTSGSPLLSPDSPAPPRTPRVSDHPLRRKRDVCPVTPAVPGRMFTEKSIKRLHPSEYPAVVELTDPDFPPELPTLCVVSEDEQTPPRKPSSPFLDAFTLGIVPLAAVNEDDDVESGKPTPHQHHHHHHHHHHQPPRGRQQRRDTMHHIAPFSGAGFGTDPKSLPRIHPSSKKKRRIDLDKDKEDTLFESSAGSILFSYIAPTLERDTKEHQYKSPINSDSSRNLPSGLSVGIHLPSVQHKQGSSPTEPKHSDDEASVPLASIESDSEI